MEAVEPDIMDQKPRPKDEGIFAHGLGIRVVLQGAMFAALSLLAFVVGENALASQGALRCADGMWNFGIKYLDVLSHRVAERFDDPSGIVCAIVYHRQQNPVNAQFGVDAALHFRDRVQQEIQTFC